MSTLARVMRILGIFFPHYFYFIFIFYMIYLDSRTDGSFWTKVAVVVAAWIIGTVIYKLYFILTPNSPQWIEDGFAFVGLLVACLFALYLWKCYNFGHIIPDIVISGLLIGFIFIVISPFWNISGHVAYTLFMIGVLALSNPAWSVLLPFVPIMVINRVYLNHHTMSESIAGMILGLFGVLVYWLLLLP